MIKRLALLVLLAVLPVLSTAQTYSDPELLFVDRETSAPGTALISDFRNLVNSPGPDGLISARSNGVREFYKFSGPNTIARLFSVSAIPPIPNQAFVQTTLDQKSEFFANAGNFFFLVSASNTLGQFGSGLCEFRNGQVKYIVRPLSVFAGIGIPFVRNLFQTSANDLTFTSSFSSTDHRVFLYRAATGAFTQIVKSGDPLPGGVTASAVPGASSRIDSVNKRIFLHLSCSDNRNRIFRCDFLGQGLTLVADEFTQVEPNVAAGAVSVQYADHRKVMLYGATPRAFYKLEDGSFTKIFGVGSRQYPDSSLIVTNCDQNSFPSQNGLWTSYNATFSDGKDRLVVIGTGNQPLSNMWIGPERGKTYIDPRTSRKFVLDQFFTEVATSNSGVVQFMARIKFVDTGTTKNAILRAYPNLF